MDALARREEAAPQAPVMTPHGASQLDASDTLWAPQLWGSHRRLPIRCLNLSKDNKIKGAPAESR